MSEPHEKYVSIEFDRWNNYYKILEEINKDLQYQVDNKDIKISMWRSHGFGHGDWYRVGRIEVGIHGGSTIKDFDRKEFIQHLEEISGQKLRSTQEDKEIDDKILNAVEKISSLPRIVRWLFNIKLPK